MNNMKKTKIIGIIILIIIIQMLSPLTIKLVNGVKNIEKIDFKNSALKEKAVQTWDYSYTGNSQIFTAPSTGKYYLKVWGASGGGATGGRGGYSEGYYNMIAGEKIYIHTGGNGSQSGSGAVGGYNGGGSSSYIAGSGGGATHISKTEGLLNSFNSSKLSVLIVAGGRWRLRLRITKYRSRVWRRISFCNI